MLSMANYQMSVFGDYAGIVPEMNLIAKLAEFSSDFRLLPSMVNVLSINMPASAVDMPENAIANAQLKTLARIKLIDATRHWNAVILPERIDVNYLPPVSGEAKDLRQVSESSCELIKHIVSVCEATYGRMAVNLALRAKPESAEKVTAFRNKLEGPFSFQSAKKSKEWQISTNIPELIKLSDDKNEAVNVICSLALQTETPGWAKVHLDVNTSPANMTPRFNDAMLTEFRVKAIDIIANMINEIEKELDNA